jgi:hypothetical protein
MGLSSACREVAQLLQRVGQQHENATMRQGLPIMHRPESTPAVSVTAGLTLCVSCYLQEQRQRLLESISSKVRRQPCLLRGAASACAHITSMCDIPRCIITCCDMSNTQYHTCHELCAGALVLHKNSFVLQGFSERPNIESGSSITEEDWRVKKLLDGVSGPGWLREDLQMQLCTGWDSSLR